MNLKYSFRQPNPHEKISGNWVMSSKVLRDRLPDRWVEAHLKFNLFRWLLVFMCQLLFITYLYSNSKAKTTPKQSVHQGKGIGCFFSMPAVLLLSFPLVWTCTGIEVTTETLTCSDIAIKSFYLRGTGLVGGNVLLYFRVHVKLLNF